MSAPVHARENRHEADADVDIRVDVVVVGARAAGASTAMLLARRGFRVLVIDRGPADADVVSTHVLMRPAVAQLHRWGLLDAVIASGAPPATTTTFHYGHDVVAVALKPDHGVDAQYSPRRTVLDPILVRAARRAGADVRHNTRMLRLRQTSAGTVIGLDAIDESGRIVRVASRLVIGADGVGSMVARLTGARTLLRGSSMTAFAYAHVPSLRTDGNHMFFCPGLTAGVIPTNDEESCVFVGMPPQRFEDDFRHDVQREFMRTLGEVAPVVEATLRDRTPPRLRIFPGIVGFIREPFGTGWALVGDAGYFKDPTTAHGITDALRDAELLADAVAESFDSSTPTSKQQAFAYYQFERDRLSLRLFEITDTIASFRWDLAELQELHRELSAEMAAELVHIRRDTALSSVSSSA